jgi:hypothetical protein
VAPLTMWWIAGIITMIFNEFQHNFSTMATHKPAHLHLSRFDEMLQMAQRKRREELCSDHMVWPRG